jgi:hypothetical protein
MKYAYQVLNVLFIIKRTEIVTNLVMLPGYNNILFIIVRIPEAWKYFLDLDSGK